MRRVTTADVSKEAFPYMTAQEIDLNYALALGWPGAGSCVA